MDKTQKTIELLKLLDGPVYREYAKLDDRTYTDGTKFVRFHDVSTDGKFYGFVAMSVPHPKDGFDVQLESLCEIYTDERIVKGCLKSIVIEKQSEARKLALGVVKMSSTEFDLRFNALDAETLGRLKTMEHIREHITHEWDDEQPEHEDGQLRLF